MQELCNYVCTSVTATANYICTCPYFWFYAQNAIEWLTRLPKLPRLKVIDDITICKFFHKSDIEIDNIPNT